MSVSVGASQAWATTSSDTILRQLLIGMVLVVVSDNLLYQWQTLIEYISGPTEITKSVVNYGVFVYVWLPH